MFSGSVKNVTVVGITGDAGFDTIVKHFTDMGGDVVLLDSEMVCGREHILSAVMHAERAFSNGTNRSRNILTEIILYSAGERQIGKAMEKMRPKVGQKSMVAVVLDVDVSGLDLIGMKRCDEILEASSSKAKNLGVEMFEGVSPETAVLEYVAMVDLMKQ
jgi:Uncharacterized conserved protein